MEIETKMEMKMKTRESDGVEVRGEVVMATTELRRLALTLH